MLFVLGRGIPRNNSFVNSQEAACEFGIVSEPKGFGSPSRVLEELRQIMKEITRKKKFQMVAKKK